jgi:hypothetical protein
MQLEVNETHKKANLSDLKVKKQLKRTILGLTVLATLMSGSVKANAASYSETTTTDTVTEQNLDEDTPVTIPDEFNYNVASACGKEITDVITVKDLNEMNPSFFYINVDGNSSLDWLNYCDNLESLTINITSESGMDKLQDITNLKSLKSLTISNATDALEINSNNFSFSKNITSLQSLSILGVDFIESGVLESLTNLKKLTISDCLNQNIDFDKLTFLDELSFGMTNSYNLPIYFTEEDYEKLTNAGVTVTANSDYLDKALEIGTRIDSIISEIGITNDMSDQEKLNKILIYVLDNLEYDSEVSNAIRTNTDHTELTQSFYQDGFLYGALEKDTAICGNYSALVSALCERAGLNDVFLESSNHAWNLIEIDGLEYYVDATWLDDNGKLVQNESVEYDNNGNKILSVSYEHVPAQQFLETNDTEGIDWYMEDPTTISTKDQNNSHEANYIPTYITIKELPTTDELDETDELTEMLEETTSTEEQVKEETEQVTETDVSKKKFEIKIGKKVWIISGGALLGILGGIGGIAYASNKKKKQRARERQRQQAMNQNNFNFYNDSMSSYDDYSSHYYR